MVYFFFNETKLKSTQLLGTVQGLHNNVKR